MNPNRDQSLRPKSSPLGAMGLILLILGSMVIFRAFDAEEPTQSMAVSGSNLDHRPPPEARDTAQSARLLAGEPMDLNRVSAQELEFLPRVGPTLARRIVSERERVGRFDSLEQLTDVRGIGPQTLQRLSAFLEVAPTTALEESR